jgi:hypothetical protein
MRMAIGLAHASSTRMGSGATRFIVREERRYLKIPPLETDSVAGHIGFELRCAERKFISLRNHRGSDLRKPVQTIAPPRRIIFSAGAGLLAVRAPSSSGAPSGQVI